MARPDEGIARDLADRMEASPFYRWAGMTLLRADVGAVDVAMELEPHHLNIQGLAHGGMIAALADTAAGLAARSKLEPGRRHVTVQLDVHYLRPAPQGRIVARGRAVRVGSQIAVCEVDVVDERDRLLARATSTLVVTPERD